MYVYIYIHVCRDIHPSPSLSLCLSLCTCLSHYVNLFLSVSISPSLSVFLSLYLSLPLSRFFQTSLVLWSSRSRGRTEWRMLTCLPSRRPAAIFPKLVGLDRCHTDMFLVILVVITVMYVLVLVVVLLLPLLLHAGLFGVLVACLRCRL